MRAAAKPRSQAELECGVEPRRGVYGALVGRLTAERRGMVLGQGKGMIDADEVSERALFRVRWKM